MALVQFDKQPENLYTHFIDTLGVHASMKHTSATPDRSSAICHLEPGDALKGGKILDFCPG